MVQRCSIKRRESSLPASDSCKALSRPTRPPRPVCDWRSRFGLPRGCLSLGLIAAAWTSVVVASTSPVSVEGGPDGLGHTYHWTISNNHASPIVRVEIPHYRASLFFAPKGWTSTCTNLVAVGAIDAPGLCIASATAIVDGIAPGRSVQFGMQLGSASVKRGTGDVVIGYADSSKLTISGILVPVPETLSDKYIPLIGLGTILAVFVVVQVLKSRKNRRLRADA